MLCVRWSSLLLCCFPKCVSISMQGGLLLQLGFLEVVGMGFAFSVLNIMMYK